MNLLNVTVRLVHPHTRIHKQHTWSYSYTGIHTYIIRTYIHTHTYIHILVSDSLVCCVVLLCCCVVVLCVLCVVCCVLVCYCGVVCCGVLCCVFLCCSVLCCGAGCAQVSEYVCVCDCEKTNKHIVEAKGLFEQSNGLSRMRTAIQSFATQPFFMRCVVFMCLFVGVSTVRIGFSLSLTSTYVHRTQHTHTHTQYHTVPHAVNTHNNGTHTQQIHTYIRSARTHSKQ